MLFIIFSLLKTAVPTLKVPELEAHGVEFLDGFETEVHRALQNHPAIEKLENSATGNAGADDEQSKFIYLKKNRLINNQPINNIIYSRFPSALSNGATTT